MYILPRPCIYCLGNVYIAGTYKWTVTYIYIYVEFWGKTRTFYILLFRSTIRLGFESRAMHFFFTMEKCQFLPLLRTQKSTYLIFRKSYDMILIDLKKSNFSKNVKRARFETKLHICIMQDFAYRNICKKICIYAYMQNSYM